MPDLIERLRTRSKAVHLKPLVAELIEAADALEAMRDALRGFTDIHDNSPDNTPWGCGLTNGHFFRAKEALRKLDGKEAK